MILIQTDNSGVNYTLELSRHEALELIQDLSLQLLNDDCLNPIVVIDDTDTKKPA